MIILFYEQEDLIPHIGYFSRDLVFHYRRSGRYGDRSRMSLKPERQRCRVCRRYSTTFEQAIATKPYGFLVKPFREKELLLALNIAVYRYQKNIELTTRQQKWLKGLLTAVIEMPGDKNGKILSLIRALTSFLPFDFIIIDTMLTGKSDSVLYRYQRTAMAAPIF